MTTSRIATLGFALTAGIALVAACTVSPPSEEVTSSSASALAITGLFPTGVNNANQLLASGAQDPHYALTVSPDPTFTGPATFVLDPTGYPIVAGPWVANSSTSQWISIRPSGTGVGVNGSYTYRTTFTLANVNPATATLTGTWSCDDDCTLRLNGTVVATRTNAYASLAAFNVPPGSNFVLGTNNLDFVVANSGGGPTGLRVATISGTAVCTQDSQCGNGNFCNAITANPAICAPKVPNGQPVPGGTCTVVLGTRTCVSGVCDTSDQKCGFVNGTGPCTPQNGATVCRSGTCSANGGVCVPTAGCAVDADCNGTTEWCNISTFTCTNKVPNGGSVPTDPGHVTPKLDGKCGGPAATLTCVSGVCDPKDDKCGLLSGDGPCTPQNGGVVCRSGLCGVSGVCIDSGSCATDADCPGQWCNVSQKKCAPKVPNSDPMPTDPGHGTPKVDGKCTGEAAKVVCVSSVCDVDDRCGLKNGTPCDPKTPIQCRSSFCASDGKCGKPDGETCTAPADCRNANCIGGVCGGPKNDGGAPDGGTTPDGGAVQSDTVILEGGGVGCNASGGSSGGGLALFAGLGLALVLARRRR